MYEQENVAFFANLCYVRQQAANISSLYKHSMSIHKSVFFCTLKEKNYVDAVYAVRGEQ